MMESAKCRSGRASDRVVATRPPGRGGKSSRPFGHEEGIAGEDAADVVLPADVRAPLEVVQSQLALEVLVHALGAPALLDASDELFSGHRLREGREDVVLDGTIAIGLLHHEPLRLAARVVAGKPRHELSWLVDTATVSFDAIHAGRAGSCGTRSARRGLFGENAFPPQRSETGAGLGPSTLARAR